MKQRARYARFTNRFVVLFCLCALVYFARGAVIMLADPQWWWLGVLAGAIALVFAFEIVWHAGYLVVDERGLRLYKLWTRVELRWEDVRCIGTLTVYGNRYSGRIPMLLISPLERPWEELAFSFEWQRMRSYLRFGDAYSFCLDDDKALRAVIQRYCPLPWMPMDGFGQRGGYRQLRRMYGPPKHGEDKKERR